MSDDDCPKCTHSPYVHEYGYDKDIKGVHMWISCKLEGCGCNWREYSE